ncbi:MAG: SusC/RagA family TonB-linked outer membrane protein, partial [Odoribacter sp.]|nr:SusC/RagA family TonB-linked outer membrane protein [Odoribacter sp.]
ETPLKVVMEPEATILSEAVATGYQTISRDRSSGSAVILNSEKLDRTAASNLVEKIEGLAPGLLNYGGEMSIRGTSSFATGTTPLLVIDGQVVSHGLSAINPDDVESMTVLKDAAATSLYGVRASNGVIVVTTKKGKSTKPTIKVSANFYINPLPDMDYLHYASTSDIIDYEIEYMTTDPTYMQDPKAYFDNMADLRSPKTVTSIGRLYYDLAYGNKTNAEVNAEIDKMRKNDFRKEYRDARNQTAVTQDYNLSVAKGGDYSNLFFSLRYEDYGKYDKSASSNRFSVYLKNELDLTKWFKLTYGANAYFNTNKTSQAAVGFNSAMPYERLKDEDGNLIYQYNYNYYLAQKINETEGLKFMGFNAIEEDGKNMLTEKGTYLKFFAHTDFNLYEGLNLGLKFQYEKNNSDQELYDEEDSYTMRYMINNFASSNGKGGFVYHIPVGGHLWEQHGRNDFLNLRGQLNYHTVIADRHDITALVGGEIRQDKWRTTRGERYGYDEDKLTYSQVDWNTISSQPATIIGQLSSSPNSKSEDLYVSDTKHRYVSAYANAGYTYDSRYTFNGSVRVEQADLFGTDPKYRYRPLWSVGASWNVSNETFMENVDWLNVLKFRVTYGITGNVDQNSSPYLLGGYITSPYTDTPITAITQAPNKLLRWEKTSTFNVGWDFSMFRRLNASVDVYRRYSSDLLASKTLDPSLGFTSARVNNGAMKNVGVEFSASYDWLKSKDWSLNTMLIAAYNKNTIEKVGYIPSNAMDMIIYPGSNYLKGDTYNSVYAYRYAGLTEEGDPSVYDQNGEIRANEPMRDIADLICAGQLTPKWNGALSIGLRWKTLEFFTKFVYYTGHSLRKDVTPLYTSNVGAGMHEDIVNRWTPENKDTDIPRMGLHTVDNDRENLWKYADRQVVSASFLKCRNIGLSYTLPVKLMQSLRMDKVVLRAQVNNPFYWTANKDDIDPEAFHANAGSRTQQQVTTYVLGLDINF